MTTDKKTEKKIKRCVKKGRDGLWYATIKISAPADYPGPLVSRYGYLTRKEARHADGSSDAPTKFHNDDE